MFENGVAGTCDQQAHGLYVQGDRHVVVNNVIFGNHDYGIQRYPSGSDAVIAFNTIVSNGLVTGKSGIVLGGTSGDAVVSNILAFNGAFGSTAQARHQ